MFCKCQTSQLIGSFQENSRIQIREYVLPQKVIVKSLVIGADGKEKWVDDQPEQTKVKWSDPDCGLEPDHWIYFCCLYHLAV